MSQSNQPEIDLSIIFRDQKWQPVDIRRDNCHPSDGNRLAWTVIMRRNDGTLARNLLSLTIITSIFSLVFLLLSSYLKYQLMFISNIVSLLSFNLINSHIRANYSPVYLKCILSLYANILEFNYYILIALHILVHVFCSNLVFSKLSSKCRFALQRKAIRSLKHEKILAIQTIRNANGNESALTRFKNTLNRNYVIKYLSNLLFMAFLFLFASVLASFLLLIIVECLIYCFSFSN